MMATLGGAPIAVKSSKLQFVTTSSTESELTAISSTITYVIWLRRLLQELGFPQSMPTCIFHDNLSAIQMLVTGNTNWQRTKHIHLRFAFITEHLELGTIRFCHCPTGDMWADIGTKLHTAASLKRQLTSMHIFSEDNSPHDT
jgi:hypothetical protein